MLVPAYATTIREAGYGGDPQWHPYNASRLAHVPHVKARIDELRLQFEQMSAIHDAGGYPRRAAPRPNWSAALGRVLRDGRHREALDCALKAVQENPGLRLL
jgi:hypothetical protein